MGKRPPSKRGKVAIIVIKRFLLLGYLLLGGFLYWPNVIKGEIYLLVREGPI